MDAVNVRRVGGGVSLLHGAGRGLLKVVDVSGEFREEVLEEFSESCHVSRKSVEVLSEIVFRKNVVNEIDHDLRWEVEGERERERDSASAT